MYKKILTFFLVVVFLFVFGISSFALTANTYGGVTPSTSTADTLIQQAMSYDTFYHSDYVVFRSSQYLYYIVWGDDFEVSNGRITSSDVEYISYNRYSNGDNTYYYEYRYGTDSSLNVTVDETIVSNIQVVGQSFLSDKVDSFNFRRYHFYFMIFGIAFLFVIMLTNLKGSRV